MYSSYLYVEGEETQDETNLGSFSEISEINFSRGPLHISSP